MHCSYHRLVEGETLCYVKVQKEKTFVVVEMICRREVDAGFYWDLKSARYNLGDQDQDCEYRSFIARLKPMARSRFYRAYNLVMPGIKCEKDFNESRDVTVLLDPSVLLERIKTFLRSTGSGN